MSRVAVNLGDVAIEAGDALPGRAGGGLEPIESLGFTARSEALRRVAARCCLAVGHAQTTATIAHQVTILVVDARPSTLRGPARAAATCGFRFGEGSRRAVGCGQRGRGPARASGPELGCAAAAGCTEASESDDHTAQGSVDDSSVAGSEHDAPPLGSRSRAMTHLQT